MVGDHIASADDRLEAGGQAGKYGRNTERNCRVSYQAAI
jgi:hypothetical protein